MLRLRHSPSESGGKLDGWPCKWSEFPVIGQVAASVRVCVYRSPAEFVLGSGPVLGMAGPSCKPPVHPHGFLRVCILDGRLR